MQTTETVRCLLVTQQGTHAEVDVRRADFRDHVEKLLRARHTGMQSLRLKTEWEKDGQEYSVGAYAVGPDLGREGHPNTSMPYFRNAILLTVIGTVDWEPQDENEDPHKECQMDYDIFVKCPKRLLELVKVRHLYYA